MQTTKLPAIEVRDLNGNTVNFAEVSNDGNPIVIVFRATWCQPCLHELADIDEVYADRQAETGVKLVAVSIDDAANASKIEPYIRSQSLKYEFYLDENSDLKRAMGVNNVPHTFLFSGTGEIVWQQNAYAPGDAEKFIEIIRTAKSK